MSSSPVLDNSVQQPQIQQKLAGIINNILQIKRSIQPDKLAFILQDSIQERTQEEHTRIGFFAGTLFNESDYFTFGMEACFSSFKMKFSSSDILLDTKPEPTVPKKSKTLPEIARNILQAVIDIWPDDPFLKPFGFHHILEKRTKDEISRIKAFAEVLQRTSDYVDHGMDGLSSESEYSSSDEPIDAEAELTAEGATTEYDGLAHPETLIGPPPESEYSSSDEWVDIEPGSITEFDDLAYVNESIVNIRQLQLSNSGQLLVKSTGHKFSLDSLETLAPNKSLSIDIITACLHLFPKLPGVWVSSLISFYHTLRRPFEKAVKQMPILDVAETHGTYPHQVYLFPLRHCNSGYSLLEVNITERYIYHYDPVWTMKSRDYVRVGQVTCIYRFILT